MFWVRNEVGNGHPSASENVFCVCRYTRYFFVCVCVFFVLRRSIVSRMDYQATRGGGEHPALYKSAWVQFISLAGLAKYTEPRSNTVEAQESSPLKWRCFPLFVKFHPVNNRSP